MKKILAVILTVTMLCAVFTACGEKGGDNNTEVARKYSSSTEAYTEIWNGMSEPFPSIGGSIDNAVDNNPGLIPNTDKDTMSYTLLIPEDVQGDVEEVSTMMHMMNANTFTGAVLDLKSMDNKAAAEAIKDQFKNNQFMCGCPDKIVIMSFDGYLAYAFGEKSIIDDFKASAEKLGATIILEENY